MIKTGQEDFLFDGESVGFNLLDFWRWNQSSLLTNALRGQLAEFLVSKALSIKSEGRVEWDSYDLLYKDTYKIEVKSSAYIQDWEQKKHSVPKFDIGLKSEWVDGKWSKEKKRNADLYVFCLLNHKERATIDPLNLEQWVFYMLKTDMLDKKLSAQKSLSLSSLERFEPRKCGFFTLKKNIDDYLKN